MDNQIKRKREIGPSNKKEKYARPILKKQKALWRGIGTSVGAKGNDCSSN